MSPCAASANLMRHSGAYLVSEVVLATRNDGKLRELLPLLAEAHVHAVTLSELGITESADEATLEVFESFEANALAKAHWFFNQVPASMRASRVVFADDSGLEVDALRGAPGVRSKRWAGHDALDGLALDLANNASLLSALEAAERIGSTSRVARYVCAAAAVWEGGALVAHGYCNGEILRVARGTLGFGYDPLFLSTELGATFAEVSREVKSRVSHRGRAFASLTQALSARGVWRTNNAENAEFARDSR